MYGGRRIPGQSFDHTRRYQNDIVVYSENELRNALGYAKRGTRIVVASEIFVTKTIDINFAKDPIVNESPEYQGITITGFGSGKLTRKAGIEEPFDLFRVRGDAVAQKVGIHFDSLNADGFYLFVMLGGPLEQFSPVFGSAISMSNLKITNCTLQNSYGLLGGTQTGAPSILMTVTNAQILNNTLISREDPITSQRNCVLVNTPPVYPYGTLHFEDSILSGNIGIDESGIPAGLSNEETISIRANNTIVESNILPGWISVFTLQKNKIELNSCNNLSVKSAMPSVFHANLTSIAENYVAGTTELQQVVASIVGNTMIGIVTNSTFSSDLKVIGNHFASFIPLAVNVFPNAECCIVRNNIGTGGRDVDGYGRISLPGEILGQIIFDTRLTVPASPPFIKSVTSNAYSQLTNDTNPLGDKAEVSFHVPCNKRVLIRLHCHLRDVQTATPPNFDQIFFEIRQSTGAIPAVNCNVDQAFYFGKNTGAGQVTNGFMPVTFEWFIDGNPGAHWTSGQAVTIEVWTKIASIGMEIEVWGGNGTAPDGSTQYAGPLKVEVEAVSDDLVSTVPSSLFKKGQKPPLKEKKKL